MTALGTEEIVLIHHTDRGMLTFIPHTDNIRGFVYEVDTGELHEVSRQPSLRR